MYCGYLGLMVNLVEVRVLRGTSVTGISTAYPNRMDSNRPAVWTVTDPQNGK